ncbi:MAG: tetratricopeptide repeat protein, partial [Chthoniobacterales bacterium]|nr:tetratricopeptide repeat protein [Chthoniobacterales bacterium]
MRAQIFILLALIVCLTSKGLAQAEPEAALASANTAYAAGRFPEAIKTYEGLVQDHHWSASLFYDLGNAYFRVGDFGRAILNYERALALNPVQPEAQANLRLVREQTRALELAPSWPEEHLAFLTIDQYTV